MREPSGAMPEGLWRSGWKRLLLYCRCKYQQCKRCFSGGAPMTLSEWTLAGVSCNSTRELTPAKAKSRTGWPDKRPAIRAAPSYRPVHAQLRQEAAQE